ncbi:hypothetical protein [Ectobacillus funiculus]|uniref:Uncharacterized protein n=1 Tax=Ectobacillus funiculus TaxID=137993 RepID=A0ABV5WH36_9BACI
MNKQSRFKSLINDNGKPDDGIFVLKLILAEVHSVFVYDAKQILQN